MIPLRNDKLNIERTLMQRWQCCFHNGTPKTFGNN